MSRHTEYKKSDLFDFFWLVYWLKFQRCIVKSAPNVDFPRFERELALGTAQKGIQPVFSSTNQNLSRQFFKACFAWLIVVLFLGLCS